MSPRTPLTHTNVHEHTCPNARTHAHARTHSHAQPTQRSRSVHPGERDVTRGPQQYVRLHLIKTQENKSYKQQKEPSSQCLLTRTQCHFKVFKDRRAGCQRLARCHVTSSSPRLYEGTYSVSCWMDRFQSKCDDEYPVSVYMVKHISSPQEKKILLQRWRVCFTHTHRFFRQ